jgi:transcriptional regulator with XRE-family HTH domain
VTNDKERVILIGRLIARARSEAGFTQDEMAGALGVSKRSIQEYESGRISGAPYLRQIEAVTGKAQGWFSEQLDPTPDPVAEELRQLRADVNAILELLRERFSSDVT